VFAHIGRPTLRALARGERPPSGELARDGQAFVVRRAPSRHTLGYVRPGRRRRVRVNALD
jgi:hypothetical protein